MADSSSSTAQVLNITDPIHDPERKLGPIDRRLAKLVRDPRDLPFVWLSIKLSLIFTPLTALMFWPGMFRWWMAPIYWAMYAKFLGPFILMLHNTTHRALYKNDLLNKHIPWLVGPFVGISPETYAAHHLGIHHAEGNLPSDLSSTMAYQRDSFRDFLKYFFAFLFGHHNISHYFRSRGRHKMLRRFWMGEIAQLTLVAVSMAVNYKAGFVAFLFPLVFSRFMMMTGNWAQHAFVDPVDWKNDYRTVVTFINSPYNHSCFNDGYHLGHHLKGNRHWLDMPADFLAKRDEMIKQESLVFRRLDYFMIFCLLMFKRYKTLSKYVVHLDPDNPWSEEKTIALLKRRVQRFEPSALAA